METAVEAFITVSFFRLKGFPFYDFFSLKGGPRNALSILQCLKWGHDIKIFLVDV